MISFQNKLEQKENTNVQNQQPPTASMALWLCHIYIYYIYTHDIPLSHWKYQVYTKSQEASGAAALAQALVEGGLMAIEVGAGDIKWSLLWSFHVAIDALWPHTWIRKRLKYT